MIEPTPPESTPPESTPMICEALAQLKEDGEPIAALLDLAKLSIYPYFSHRTPSYEQLRKLLLNGSHNVQLTIIHQLLAGTGWAALAPARALDTNGDGKIDMYDAIAANAKAMRDFASVLTFLSEQRDGKITDELIHQIMTLANNGIAAAQQSISIVSHLAAHEQRRRKCRPLPGAPGSEAGQ